MGGGEDLRCVHCGAEVKKLLVQYSPGNICLMKCDICKAVADPYVECELMIVLIDLILHKQKAYRHLLYNMLSEDGIMVEGLVWKLALAYLALDGGRSLLLKGIADDCRLSSNLTLFIWICKLLLALVLGNLVFFGILLYAVKVLLRLPLDKNRLKRLLLATLFSSYFKIFFIAMMVWEFPTSAIFIIDTFFISSNSVALKVLSQLRTSTCIAVCFGAHAAKLLVFALLFPPPTSNLF